MTKSSLDTALVLGGCHALISINGAISGDPLEEAVIKAIDFTYDPITLTSAPRSSTASGTATTTTTTTTTTTITTTTPAVPAKVRPLPERGWGSVKEDHVKIQTLHHFHFASKLQRMSVVAKVNDGAGKAKMMSLVKGTGIFFPGRFRLRSLSTKSLLCFSLTTLYYNSFPFLYSRLLLPYSYLHPGSPEVIETLLLPGQRPSWYFDAYKDLTRHGMRVLALASKDFDSKMVKLLSFRKRKIFLEFLRVKKCKNLRSFFLDGPALNGQKKNYANI
jgi:cation-transporting ATPase 13A1